MKVTLDLYVDDLEEGLQNSYSLNKLNLLSFKNRATDMWWDADEVWFNYEDNKQISKPTKSIKSIRLK